MGSVIQSNDPFFPASLKSNNNLSVTVCHSGAKAKEKFEVIHFLCFSDISPLPKYRMIDSFFPTFLKSNNNWSVTVCNSGAKAKERFEVNQFERDACERG